MAGRKRKIGADRRPSGRAIADKPGPSPAALVRAREAILSDVRRAEFGTAWGMMFLREEITASQFEAAKWFASLRAAYCQAIAAPTGIAPQKAEAGVAGHPADVDTEAGDIEARRHAATVARYDEAVAGLAMRGPAIKAATIALCDGRAYLSWQELLWARAGLAQIAEDRGDNRRRKNSA